MDAPQTLYRYPVNRGVARFVGQAVLVPGTASGDEVDCCFGRLPLVPKEHRLPGTDSGPVEVLIRPEQFRLCQDDSKGDAIAGPARTARVELLCYYGHDARLHLRLENGTLFSATIPGFSLPEVGQTIRFKVTGSVFTYPDEGESSSI